MSGSYLKKTWQSFTFSPDGGAFLRIFKTSYMKELENPLQQLQPEQEVNVQVEQQKHYKLIGSVKIKPGHHLYAVNWHTREVIQVNPVTETARMLTTGKVEARRKVMIMPDHFYTSALNAENALKHYLRMIK